VRFEAIAPPDVVYQAGYHDGANEFGWRYTDASRQEYELALAHRRLDWVEVHRPPGTMVDIGGGAGHLVAAAGERGWTATLVEPVERTVAFATRAFGVDAVCGGIEHVEACADRYDLISLVHVLEHFPEPVDHLRRLRSRLTERGALFVEVPNYRSLARRWLGERWMGWRAGEHVHQFTRKTLHATLRGAGYDVVATRTMVPAWSGLGPAANAHFLGVEPLLEAVVSKRHGRLGVRAGTLDANGVAATAWRPPTPRPVRESRGLRRVVYGTGFSALRAMEEATGLGSNLLALARALP
jgi:SAM-dependent methyltransferase